MILASRKLTHACAATALALAAGANSALALAPGQPGIVLTFPVSTTADNAYAAAVDPDGGLVMAGSGKSGAYGALARRTSAGAADTLFGPDGYVVHDLNTNQVDFERALVRMSDGRYVACGIIFGAGTATDFLTARFNADGSLDTSFNSVGYAATPFLTSGSGAALYDQCNAVGLQSDGKIISAGYTDAAGPARVAVTRHTTSGALDTTFGDHGKVMIDASLGPAAESSVQALVVLPDDKLLLAGNAGGTFNNIDFLLMRLNADGSPDTQFGTNGIVRTPIGAGADIANAMVVQPDGRIVLAGSSAAADTRADFALARYLADGTPDSTFGGGSGHVTTAIGPGEDVAYALTLMPWGRLVAAGSARISTTASGTDVALAAYNTDGSLDKYFGTGGKVMLQVTAQPDEVIYGLGVDIDHQHFWAVGAGVPLTDRDFMVLDFGLPDTIFRDGFEIPTP